MDYGRHIFLGPVDGSGTAVDHHEHHRTSCCMNGSQQLFLTAGKVERGARAAFPDGEFIASEHHNCHIGFAGKLYGLVNHGLFRAVKIHIIKFAFREISVAYVAAFRIVHLCIGEKCLDTLINCGDGRISRAVPAHKIPLFIGVGAYHSHALEILGQRKHIAVIFQEHQRFKSRALRHCAVLGRMNRAVYCLRTSGIGIVEKTKHKFHAEHVGHAAVDGLF